MTSQFSHDGIGWKTHVKFDIMSLVSFDLSIVSQIN